MAKLDLRDKNRGREYWETNSPNDPKLKAIDMPLRCIWVLALNYCLLDYVIYLNVFNFYALII